jgi:hypothetical protein
LRAILYFIARDFTKKNFFGPNWGRWKIVGDFVILWHILGICKWRENNGNNGNTELIIEADFGTLKSFSIKLYFGWHFLEIKVAN